MDPGFHTTQWDGNRTADWFGQASPRDPNSSSSRARASNEAPAREGYTHQLVAPSTNISNERLANFLHAVRSNLATVLVSVMGGAILLLVSPIGFRDNTGKVFEYLATLRDDHDRLEAYAQRLEEHLEYQDGLLRTAIAGATADGDTGVLGDPGDGLFDAERAPGDSLERFQSQIDIPDRRSSPRPPSALSRNWWPMLITIGALLLAAGAIAATAILLPRLNHAYDVVEGSPGAEAPAQSRQASRLTQLTAALRRRGDLWLSRRNAELWSSRGAIGTTAAAFSGVLALCVAALSVMPVREMGPVRVIGSGLAVSGLAVLATASLGVAGGLLVVFGLAREQGTGAKVIVGATCSIGITGSIFVGIALTHGGVGFSVWPLGRLQYLRVPFLVFVAVAVMVVAVGAVSTSLNLAKRRPTVGIVVCLVLAVVLFYWASGGAAIRTYQSPAPYDRLHVEIDETAISSSALKGLTQHAIDVVSHWTISPIDVVVLREDGKVVSVPSEDVFYDDLYDREPLRSLRSREIIDIEDRSSGNVQLDDSTQWIWDPASGPDRPAQMSVLVTAETVGRPIDSRLLNDSESVLVVEVGSGGGVSTSHEGRVRVLSVDDYEDFREGTLLTTGRRGEVRISIVSWGAGVLAVLSAAFLGVGEMARRARAGGES